MAQRVGHNPMEAATAALVSPGLCGFNCGCPGPGLFDLRSIRREASARAVDFDGLFGVALYYFGCSSLSQLCVSIGVPLFS